MVKTLQIVGVLSLISAGIVLVFWAMECLRLSQGIGQDAELSIVEKYKRSSSRSDPNDQDVPSPLFQQAEAFALYLNPPAPPKEREIPSPPEKQPVAIESPKIKAVELSAKFELHGISYYLSKPEESMALIWEPGSGHRWIKQGGKLGHFIIEQIRSTSIVYRDELRTHEMAFVPERATVRVADDHNSNTAPKEPVEAERITPRPSLPGSLRRTPPTRVAAKSTPG